jgi:octanoyl-[GcvH]:protein N-octanoyltransferase
VDLLTDHHPDPRLDMAIAGAILQAVAVGASKPAIHVYRPGASVAFGRLDARRPRVSERD